jgi:hypothetical protein
MMAIGTGFDLSMMVRAAVGASGHQRDPGDPTVSSAILAIDEHAIM